MRILLKSIQLFGGLRIDYEKKMFIVFANIFLSIHVYLRIKTVVVLSVTHSSGTGVSCCSMTVMLWTDTLLLILFSSNSRIAMSVSACLCLISQVGRLWNIHHQSGLLLLYLSEGNEKQNNCIQESCIFICATWQFKAFGCMKTYHLIIL